LHDSAGEGGRFETGGAIRAVRQPADLAGRRAGGSWGQLDRPLCDAGDLSAVERDFAADGAARASKVISADRFWHASHSG
jgi:hypothetical protein